jgi:hypothetical protein
MISWPQYPIPKWVLKRMDERFVEGLFDAQMAGKLDEATDRHVYWVLLSLRWQRAIYPYLQIFKLMWEIVRGKYWRAATQVHGSSDATSGTGPGAGGVPVAQFTTAPGPVAAAGFTAGTSAGVAGFFEDAGIKAGEVTAYRCWTLGAEGLLHSMFIDFVWQPGVVVEGKPSNNSAGIHAFKSIVYAAQYAGYDATSVTGTVDLWGEVYEHERGYRAQYAAIASIDDSPHYDAATLRELYGLNKKKRKKK